MRRQILGVYQVDKGWKVYAEHEGAAAFPDRTAALEAAERAARTAAARGWKVELYVQDAQGALQRINLASIAH